MSSGQGGFAMTGAFAAGLLSPAPFTYTSLAVWRYFLVAHQRYFGEIFLVNQRLTRNPTLRQYAQRFAAIYLAANLFCILGMLLPAGGWCGGALRCSTTRPWLHDHDFAPLSWQPLQAAR